ncbi:MAG: lipoprotein-releasing system ATP-binding protein LolD [Candidatus Kapaibacterium sp.]|nr:MAG: lipoprotein-releasing system ATP-binding protein LolD [Candidatus Kapabacteria bacterium]
MTILDARDIVKIFPEPVPFQVLRGISLTIARGEFVSIVGKSGCGKSTLLYVLSTLDTDYRGTLTIADTVVTGKDQDFLAHFRGEHIGFIFQFHFLLQEFTILDNVLLPALKLGKEPPDRVRDRAMGLLERMGIADCAHRPAKQLSGGQQQRAAIARALINQPALVIGDEPTGNLDSENTAAVLDLLSSICRDMGQTVVIVTHDREVAARSDRILTMADGRIIGQERRRP